MESNTEQVRQLKKILSIIFRRRLLLVGFLLFGVSVGLVAYLMQTKMYEASALLVYQQQKVSESKLSPADQRDIHDVISTLVPLITSRTSLEQIIKSQKLFVREREVMPMQDVVEMMRENIDIRPAEEGSTFMITYLGDDKQAVARVTNTLAGRFIEENLKERQDRAVETSNYTRDELAIAKKTLDAKEAVLRDYKLKFYNEMPEQQIANLRRLDSLQQQYQKKQESIQDLEKTRVLIQDQISARRMVLSSLSQVSDSVITVPEKSSVPRVAGPREQLAQLEAARKSMLRRYTAKHPRLRSVEKKIAALKKQLEDDPQPQQSEQTSAGDSEKTAMEIGSGIHDDQLFTLQMQLKDIRLSIQKISDEMILTKEQIDKYEDWIAATPNREAEWAQISREYGELKRHYDFLVAQNLQASAMKNLELKQQGSQFRIEDPARMPNKPEKPNFLIFMAASFFGGFVLGAGIALLLEFLDTSFRDPDSMETSFDIPVLCSIPNFPLGMELTKRRMKYMGEGVFMISWTLLFLVALAICFYKGKIII